MKRKWYSLIDKVYEPKNLEDAWKKVRANRGSAGIDRESIAQFTVNEEQNLTELHRVLRNKKYRPMPVRRVFIPKSKGRMRPPLGIPTLRDRMVQQALLIQTGLVIVYCGELTYFYFWPLSILVAYLVSSALLNGYRCRIRRGFNGKSL